MGIFFQQLLTVAFVASASLARQQVGHLVFFFKLAAVILKVVGN